MRAMAGFSLSISRGQEQGETETLFLYGSGGAGVEISTRGFELWQPAPPSQDQEIQLSLPQHELGGSVRRGASGAGGGGFSCQDCGNQAKKDCAHMRCRTCCKSRGLHCPTHVKSTWIPVAKRRERQQQRTAGNTAAAMSSQRERDPGADQGGKHGGGGQLSRRQKEVADLTTGASGATRGSYPAEVSTHAAFRCVRVSAADEAEDERAYQTAVSIGGHVFKGILYDHGPEAETATLTPGAGPSCFHRHLTGSSSPPPADIMAAAAAAAAAASAAGAEPSATAPAAVAFLDAYPASLNAFMAGTQFFPHHSRP